MTKNSKELEARQAMDEQVKKVERLVFCCKCTHLNTKTDPNVCNSMSNKTLQITSLGYKLITKWSVHSKNANNDCKYFELKEVKKDDK